MNAQGHRIVVIIDAKKFKARWLVVGQHAVWRHTLYWPFFHPIFIALNNNFNRVIFLATLLSLSLSLEIIISHPINDHRHNRTTCLQSNNNNNAIHDVTRRFPRLSNEIAMYKSLTIKIKNRSNKEITVVVYSRFLEKKILFSLSLSASLPRLNHNFSSTENRSMTILKFLVNRFLMSLVLFRFPIAETRLLFR